MFDITKIAIGVRFFMYAKRATEYVMKMFSLCFMYSVKFSSLNTFYLSLLNATFHKHLIEASMLRYMHFILFSVAQTPQVGHRVRR